MPVMAGEGGCRQRRPLARRCRTPDVADLLPRNGKPDEGRELIGDLRDLRCVEHVEVSSCLKIGLRQA